jgi:hypothetical protein
MIAGQAFDKSDSAVSTVFGEEAMRAVDALPGVVAEASEDDLLKEGSAVGAGGVVPAALGAGYGGDRG